MNGMEGTRRARLAVTFAKRRQVLLLLAVVIWGAVWARAIQLQLVADDQLRDLAYSQSNRRISLPAPRGEILDREGRLLAINNAVRSYFSYPDSLQPAHVLAERFGPLRGMSIHAVAREFSERANRFTWMIRRCDTDLAERIDSWQLPGVFGTWEFQRVYPHAMPGFAGPLGFVNDTMGGGAGLEKYYDEVLRGKDGEGVFVADATGRRFNITPNEGRRPEPGANLRLTIDARWQSILGEEVAHAVDTFHAKSGMGLIMDPHTGGIIAMVDVDPGRPANRPILKSRLVSDVFEPGSTFKLITFAGALADGVVTLRRYFDGNMGVGLFSGRPIRDDKRHGVISVEEAFVLSSNIVTGRIANLMEDGRLDFWVRRFGFGQRTGIDFPGESPGRIAQQQNSEFNIAQRSFGHGIAVTPLQLAAAYSVIANGGYLIKPHLVEAIEHADGTVERIPVQGERILPPEVAHLMQRLARGVVERGTGKYIYDSLFLFAGKTGTAEKPDPATGTYNKNKYIASFIGFYPADNPRIVGLVILDEPEPIHYGGLTAAPTLLNVVRRAASSGDVPGTRFAAPDEPPARQLDWADRLLEFVGPLITPGPLEAHAWPSDSLKNVDDTWESELPPGCVSGWDRLMGHAAKVRAEKELAPPASAPAVTTPVVEQQHADSLSRPIAATPSADDAGWAAAESEDERP